MAELYLLYRDGTTRRADIGDDSVTLGRNRSNDIVVPDSRVSGFHAEFQRLPDQSGHLLRDLGSYNGTRVNGELIHEAALSTCEVLYFGDLIAVYLQSNLERIRACAQAPVSKAFRAAGGGEGRHLRANRRETSWWGHVPHVFLVFAGPSEMLLYPTKSERVRIGREPENDIVIMTPEIAAFNLELRYSGEHETWDIVEMGRARTRKSLNGKAIHRDPRSAMNEIRFDGVQCWLRTSPGKMVKPSAVNARSIAHDGDDAKDSTVVSQPLTPLTPVIVPSGAGGETPEMTTAQAAPGPHRTAPGGGVLKPPPCPASQLSARNLTGQPPVKYSFPVAEVLDDKPLAPDDSRQSPGDRESERPPNVHEDSNPESDTSARLEEAALLSALESIEQALESMQWAPAEQEEHETHGDDAGIDTRLKRVLHELESAKKCLQETEDQLEAKDRALRGLEERLETRKQFLRRIGKRIIEESARLRALKQQDRATGSFAQPEHRAPERAAAGERKRKEPAMPESLSEPREATAPVLSADPTSRDQLLEAKASRIERLKEKLRSTSEAIWNMKKDGVGSSREAAVELVRQENALIEQLRREKETLFLLMEE